jgi:NADH-quinone oxidoreductase subunit L
MNSLTYLVPLLPLATFLVNFLFFRKNRHLAPYIAIGGVLAAFVLSLSLAARLIDNVTPILDEAKWLDVSGGVLGNFTIKVGTLLDPLCAMMLLVVTGISTLVHIYSLGYMHDEPGIVRFFLYLNLFTFSMLGLVVSPNLYQMYIFWELVGLCSYLLIGFYYDKKSANDACKKAFIVNRVGDFGMFLGILFLTYFLGTADFLALPHQIANWPMLGPAWLPLGVVALLLFCGAVGKSAQFPLHIWLPDAMEGPTPVSALIHAATMVAAGVYMVARAYVVFDAANLSSVNAAQVVAWVGGFTSIFAATIACTQFDIKRVLAYSTLSQLGYMVMALGAGGSGVSAGSFHLFTHAFFKALLFLGSGSVIHAMHTNDVRKMGGLWKKLPITGTTFFIACIAIAGVPPLAGFFSKDEILLSLKEAHLGGLYTLASSVAFLTAFYMFRLFFMTFTGSEPAEGHPHESPFSMTLPLMILAVLSVVAGWSSLGSEKNFGHYISYERPAGLQQQWDAATALAAAHPEARGTVAAHALIDAAQLPPPAPTAAAAGAGEESHQFQWVASVWIPATLIGLAGIFLAMLMYLFKVFSPDIVVKALGPVYTVIYNKYYIDEAYAWIVHRVYFVLSKGIAWFDRHVVDGFMNGLAWGSQVSGSVLKRVQSGQVQAYALVFALGLTALLIFVKNVLF